MLGVKYWAVLCITVVQSVYEIIYLLCYSPYYLFGSALKRECNLNFVIQVQSCFVLFSQYNSVHHYPRVTCQSCMSFP